MTILAPPNRRSTTADPEVVRPAGAASLEAWRALRWIGAAFLFLGVLDIALGWFPAAFGNMEWEFGTITGSLNALAIPMLGLYLLLASSVALMQRRSARVVAVLMGLLLVALLALGVIYLTVLPVAIKAVSANAAVVLGVQKAAIKALALGLVDCALLVVGIRKAWRVPRG